MNRQEFYESVAEILGVGDFTYKDYTRMPKRRWRPRIPANGCFPGKAWVQWFSETLIRVYMAGKAETFKTPEEALEFIRGF